MNTYTKISINYLVNLIKINGMKKGLYFTSDTSKLVKIEINNCNYAIIQIDEKIVILNVSDDCKIESVYKFSASSVYDAKEQSLNIYSEIEAFFEKIKAN